ncbi:MAG: MFS transporter [Deltaproteobacteria bacterium]|jgi:MFS family permease|nr:MFS transporter [Deltaproteobacteria bacterium]
MNTVLLLGFVSLLTDVSSEMVYPLLSLYLMTSLGATPAIVGVIEGIAESLASLLKTYSGYISDRIQRRKPLAIVGYGSAAVGKLFLYLSTSWGWVLAGRVVDRFGKGVRTAPRDALIADASQEGRLGHSFGLHRALDTLGAVFGIAIAYYLFTATKGQYTRIFLFSLLPGILGVLLLFFVKEKKPRKAAAKVHPLAGWRKLNPRLKAFFLVAFLFTLGNSSNQFLLLRANNLGFDAANVILAYLICNFVYAVSAYPAGRLSDHIGRRTLLVFGYLFYGLVYLGFAFASQRLHVWVLFGVYGLYSGLTEGIEKALVAELCPGESRATMLGVHATLVGIGLLPASLIGGFLWRMIGPGAPFYFGGVVGILAALGMFFVVPRLKPDVCPA